MSPLKVFCFLALMGLASTLVVGDLRLELASVVFRHGDRSPAGTFPTDKYSESDWPQGYGQLSIAGMQQQYRLGQLLRERYVVNGSCDGLVCANYTRVQVVVRSTDVDRTLMSVESQLAAFFPPSEEDQAFDADLVWQPIPVHTVSLADDTLLLSMFLCPAYFKLQQEDYESAAFKKMEDKYKDFLQDVSVYTGQPVNLASVLAIADTVYTENVSEGYEAPSWATEEVRANLTTLTDYTFTLWFNSTAKKRLTAGPWLGKIVADMKDKSNKTQEDIKLFLYSSHDTTVAAMTSGLGVFNDKQPPYATAFAVELYSDAQGQYYVKMFERTGPDSDVFEPLSAPYCDNQTLCTLQEFESYVNPLVPTDFAEECNPSTPNPTPDPHDLEQKNKRLTSAVIVLGTVLGVVLILLTVILISVCRKKSLYTAKINLPIEQKLLR